MTELRPPITVETGSPADMEWTWPELPSSTDRDEADAFLDRRFERVPERRPRLGVYLGLAIVVAIAVWITGTADIGEAALAALLTAVPTTLGRLWRDHQRMAQALPASAVDVLSADKEEPTGFWADALFGAVIGAFLVSVGALFDDGAWWGIGAAVGIVVGSDVRALALRAIVPRLHPDAAVGHRLDGDGDDVYRLFALEPPPG